MLVVGLTGNIGSGKSTVSGFFSELDIPSIDSDQIARQAVLPGTEALKQIVSRYGRGILLHDHTLDRKQLREKIFASNEERLWLENLLHPIIRVNMAQQLSQLDTAYALLEIPLLIGRETTNPFIQRILLVDTPLALQQQRVELRDQINVDQFAAIAATQAQRDALLHAADDIIVNDKSLAELKQQVLVLHEKYLRLALNCT